MWQHEGFAVVWKFTHQEKFGRLDGSNMSTPQRTLGAAIGRSETEPGANLCAEDLRNNCRGLHMDAAEGHRTCS